MPDESLKNGVVNKVGRLVVPLHQNLEQFERFTQFVEVHYEDLLKRARKLSYKEFSPQELLNETIELILSGKSTYTKDETHDALMGYMVTLMRRVRNHRFWNRQHAFEEGRRIEHVEDETISQRFLSSECVSDLADVVEDQTSLDEDQEHVEQVRILHTIARQRLPPKDRQLLEWHLDGLPYTQIKERYRQVYGNPSVSITALKTRLGRIKGRLMVYIRAHVQDE